MAVRPHENQKRYSMILCGVLAGLCATRNSNLPSGWHRGITSTSILWLLVVQKTSSSSLWGSKNNIDCYMRCACLPSFSSLYKACSCHSILSSLLYLRFLSFVSPFYPQNVPDFILPKYPRTTPMGMKNACLAYHVGCRSASVLAAYITQVPTTKPSFLYQNVTGFTFPKLSSIGGVRIYKITIIGFMA